MLSVAYDVGDRVQWPMTSVPAEPGQSNALTIEDRILTRHLSGKYHVSYLFAELESRIVEDMHRNVEAEFDNLVCIIGEEGVGKSHLAHHIALQFDPEFDMEKSLIYSWLEFLDSVTSDDPQRIYWFDEAVMVAAGRNWMSEANKMLFEALQFIRSMGLTIIMCIPSFDNIDVYIRTFRTRFLLKAQMMAWTGDAEPVRGYCDVRLPLPKAKRDLLPDDCKAEDYFESKGYFRYPPMSPEAEAQYKEIKRKHQKDKLIKMRDKIRKQEESESKAKDKEYIATLILWMLDDKGMSYSDISDLTGMPYNTVKNIAWKERDRRKQE